MKLALVGPVYPYRGGIAQFTSRLGQVLLEKGHSAQIISFSRQYPAFLYPGKTDKDPSREHPVVEADFILDPLYPWTWLRAVDLIKRARPDCVFLQWWTSFWAPAFWILAHLLKANHIPVSFIIHNVMPHEHRPLDRWLSRAVLSQACACIPLSPREEQRAHHLLPGMRLETARLPVESLSTQRPTREQARKQLGIADDEKVLLAFGIVRPYKGLKVILEALGILKNQDMKPYLLVVGEFWEDVTLYRQQIEQLDLTNQVRIENRFVPNEEVATFYSAADIFVAPYLGGSQSATIKVAMQFQLPILASDRISSDLPLNTYPIHVHPAGDAGRLAVDILTAIQHPDQLQPSAAVAFDCGWDAVISAVQKVRDECLARR